MTHVRHPLTDTEIACGVTLDQISQLLPTVLRIEDGVVLPKGLSPALGSSLARAALGVPATFRGTNQLGLPVYRPAEENR